MSERSYYFKDGKHYVTGGIIPPIIINTASTYSIVPWWVEIPIGTTLDDIVWVKENIESTQSNSIEFKSSSSNDIYFVTKRLNKHHCTCPGYWRSKDRVCKHIKQVIKENIL